MPELIPFDQDSAAQLEDKISKTKFRSTDTFIDFYNSGLLNKTAPEVVELANEIDEAFKNVRLQGKNLVFISANEVYMAEITESIALWEIIVKIKRALTDLASENEVNNDSVVVFSSSSAGVLFKEEAGEENVELVKLTDEKFFRGQDLINAIADERSSLENNDEDNVRFVVSDFTALEDSFIADIHGIIFS